jgi:hypothetical protein
VLCDTPAILEDITRAIDGWSGGAGPNLAFTGMEPFNHPEIDRITREANRAGAKRLRLETSAVALGRPDVAKAALDGGVRHLRFALLGSTPEAHDMLTGTAGRFDATLRGVEAFAELAADARVTSHISALIPLCRHNLQDVGSTIPAAARAGASAILIAVQDEHLDVASAVPWIEAACDTGVVNTAWVEVEGVPLCAATGWELHLASTYRTVQGAKAPACSACPLNAVCGGTASGASDRVLAALRPPLGAREFAAALDRGFHPLESTNG